ncbi:MAG: hypothetical protein QOC56_1028, partial [Alphaproteobacteria bacterium]|nr:hypothetical protein [Alphaproteobacteria bacterium]
MSLPVWLQSVKTLKLRAKLIAAFAGMATMAGFCGIVGLVFVQRIGASVSMFSDVTSPLLTESDAVVDNARRLRATVFRVLASGEIMPEKLAQLRADGTRHLQALRELAAKAKIEVALDDVEQYKREFVQILERMSEVSQQKKAAFLVTQERTASFQAKRRDVDALLLDLANRAQGKILRTEDEAKVQVQTGAATVEGLSDMLSDVLTETYPIVQNTGRLLRQVDQIDDAARLLLVQTDAAALAAVEQRVKRTFNAIDAVIETLAGRLRDADGTVELTKFRSGILGLETALLGPDGLFERHRDAVTTQAERAADRANLDRIDRTYLQMVENIKSAVGTLNQEAQLNAANGITQAHKVVAASVVTTVLAGLAFGFFFAGRITRPLTRLTDHVVQIREKGELNALPGVAEAGRVDEIGMLSRSFNLMIAELADARRRLIAWSEAEIHTQYQRLNAAINNMPQGLCMFDAEQKLIICNRRYAEIYGLPPEHTVPGTTLRTILRHRVESSRLQNAEDFVESRLAVIAENKPWYQVSELNDGQVIAISHQPMADGGLIATHEDVTERRKAELQIAYMAHHDALTALPNRVRLREEMEKALTRTARGESVAVLCIDL